MANPSETIRENVRARYGAAARVVSEKRGSACCCGSTKVGDGIACADPITSNLYDQAQVGSLPIAAVQASLGCGNPTALAELRPGEVVLDLGSGGGIDVLLSARRVSPGGKAYGLDMTPEMLDLARRNLADSGVANAEFLEGTLEQIPLPAQSVDVIISNCVINLSADKDRALAEAYRVLRAGGRLAVSDIAWTRPVPDVLRRSAELWIGCMAGAMLLDEYRERLERAGFSDIDFEITRTYGGRDVGEMAAAAAADGISLTDAEQASLDGAAVSVFVRARR